MKLKGSNKQLTACLLPNNSLSISLQNSRAGESLLPLPAESVCVRDSAAPSVESFLDFFVDLTTTCATLLVDDDDGLVMVGVGEESNGVSYGDVLITAAPGVVVSAFLFTPFLVCICIITLTSICYYYSYIRFLADHAVRWLLAWYCHLSDAVHCGPQGQCRVLKVVPLCS